MKLITPSKIPILIIAFFLDLTSLFLPFFDFIIPGGGTLLSLVWDFIGFCTVGLWIMLTAGTSGTKNVLGKILGATFVESIPYLGDISPSWTILVLLTKIESEGEVGEKKI